MSLDPTIVQEILDAAGSRNAQVAKVLRDRGFLPALTPPPPPTPQQASGLSTYDYEKAQKRPADEPQPTPAEPDDNGVHPTGEPNAAVEGEDQVDPLT